ncbi:MAG TPA: hypothetical protein GX504_00440 [Clostridia bacterium]|nr:hypothetical protein [Clostridia bacterium]
MDIALIMAGLAALECRCDTCEKKGRLAWLLVGCGALVVSAMLGLLACCLL